MVMELTSFWHLLVLARFCVVMSLVTADISDKTPIEGCSNQQYKENERNSYLWTLRKYPSVFLFGSIHRPYPTVWPMIPRNVKKAFKSSEKIYFEIDLTSLRYLLTIMKCQLLPNQQTLSSVLPPNILEKLRRYLSFVRTQMPSWLGKNEKTSGRNADKVFEDMTMNWNRKRPIWMSLQLTSLNENDVRTSAIPSLDLYLFLKARRAGKTIGNIESAKEHCGLNNINTSQAIFYLNEMLTKYELAREGKLSLPAANELTYHYLCGNLSAFMFSPKNVLVNSTLTSRDQTVENSVEESLTQELLLKRNKNMAEKIIKEIQSTNPKEGKRMFFTVGAGHLIGKGSIIEILEQRGFKARHIKVKDPIPRTSQVNMTWRTSEEVITKLLLSLFDRLRLRKLQGMKRKEATSWKTSNELQ